MGDETQGAHKRKTNVGKQVTEWNAPQSREIPVFRHECTCAHCGRYFVIEESLQPVGPIYCLESDPEGCFKQRRAAYMRKYRAKQKGGQ